MKNPFLDKFHFLARNLEAANLLENFWVSSITSILTIRAFLKITGYPQLLGGPYHIAHMLWGGFIMMFALFLSLVFLNKEAKNWSAILGGVGFGMFIDELGKYMTKDNDYFFQPTIAFIYVIFILLYFSIRSLEMHLEASDKEYAINALEVAKEIVLYDLDDQERERALQYLSKSDPQNPIVSPLQNMLKNMQTKSVKNPSFFAQSRRTLRDMYLKLVHTHWFAQVLTLFFIVFSILSFLKALFFIDDASSFPEWGQLLSSLFSGGLVLLGILSLLERKRLRAYFHFKRAVLISVFLTQFFLFYVEQLSAIVALFASVSILIALQYLIEQEQLLQLTKKREASIQPS
ncbi:MAG TPA: hypothetical protein VJB91_03445 [Patescibacteria group bacterium]|nr:hypothetical protein [Patescibacteria group bacterium]